LTAKFSALFIAVSTAPPAAYTNELAGISGLVLVPDELEAQSLMPE